MIILLLAVIAVGLTAVYLARLCVRGIATGTFPPNGGTETLDRLTTPVKFWVAEGAVAMAIAALIAVGSLFVLAITTARS